MPFIVAIVGRPNVGKSSLFNRLVGYRHSIINDESGVTRDRIYASASWLTKKFSVIDTGGIAIGDAPFLTEIKEQALLAIDEANLILFVVDGKTGLVDNDYFIAKTLYKTNKKILLVVNKIDNQTEIDNTYEFYSLGFDQPYPVSSQHGIGIGDLADEIIKYIEEENPQKTDNVISFCVLGRPNVGKSSLVNAILGKNRVIVSEIADTTRDSIDSHFKRDGQEYLIIDTAGIKKRGKIYENTEKYALLRALSSLERADIGLLVIDGSEGVLEQDKHVAGYILEYFKAVVIVVNKWDAVIKNEKTMKKMTDQIREEFKFLDFAPIVFISAKENTRINTVFEAINEAYENYTKEIQTSTLNEILDDAVTETPPSLFNHGRAKFNYITQVAIKPPTFAVFVNNPDFIHFSYHRYLTNQFRESFGFTGTPIKLLFRKKD